VTRRGATPVLAVVALVGLAVSCGHGNGTSYPPTGMTSPDAALRVGVAAIAAGDYDLLYRLLDPRQKARFSPTAIQCPYFGVFDPTVWAEHNPGAVPVAPHNLSPFGDVDPLDKDVTGLGVQRVWSLSYAGDYHLALLATDVEGTYWVVIDSVLGSQCHPDK
jgi:hypothetical protein